MIGTRCDQGPAVPVTNVETSTYQCRDIWVGCSGDPVKAPTEVRAGLTAQLSSSPHRVELIGPPAKRADGNSTRRYRPFYKGFREWSEVPNDKTTPPACAFRKANDPSGGDRHRERLGRPELLRNRLAVRLQSRDVDRDRLDRAFTALVD